MTYIPTKNSLLVAWCANFAALITLNPTAYGLQTSDAVTIQTESDTFSDAYTAATDPSTRTRGTVADMNGAKAHMLSIVRPYAQQINANLGVTNEQRADLGLTIRDTSHTPVAPPTTYPILSILGATPLEHTLRFADQMTPSKRAKPTGAVALLLFRNIGTTAITDPTAAAFLRMATVIPIASDFDSGDVGKIATYFGVWVNRKGDVGPWSAPVHMTIA